MAPAAQETVSRATAILADDHPMIRQALRQILSDLRISVVAEADDGLQAIAHVRAHQPDLLVLDISMPHARGIEVFAEARRWSPATRVLVLSGMTSSGLFGDFIEAGAEGVFLKSSDMSALTAAIPAILGGNTVIGKEVSDLLKTKNSADTLTLREREILSMISNGMTNRQIAERLGVSVKTVDNHRTNLMRKVDAHSIAELFSYAIRKGLLDGMHDS